MHGNNDNDIDFQGQASEDNHSSVYVSEEDAEVEFEIAETRVVKDSTSDFRVNISDDEDIDCDYDNDKNTDFQEPASSGDNSSLNILEEDVEGEFSEPRVRDMSSDFTVTI